MKFSYTLPILSLLGSVFADDSYYTTMTPAEPPIGNTNPAGTYGIKLLTMDNNKLLAKRGVDQGRCTTQYSTGYILGGIYPVRTTATRINCVLKRDNNNGGCHSSVVETTTTDCPIWTMTFTNEYMVPPGETGALVTATYTDTANCQAIPTTYTTVSCVDNPEDIGKRDTGYGSSFPLL
ncbi:unnamed protein product [Ambrosiozyma monospora]|uniref:Unnamed protein product n=1 Tax=Ambrosiozyma monospora TaxID=43982 RepID=A0ACB5SWC5_AMBMO|nr:unnamed protein product [Ambrosiozyma monospora]